MYWDPEVESPASIAIIGGGPVGIEAALYGRFLGYDIDLYDARRPANAVTRWNNRPLGVDVAASTTALGMAALAAQITDFTPPAKNLLWSGKAFSEDYLIPIAKSDLLIDGIHINSRVVEVSRVRYRYFETDNLQERANDEFRLVIESRDRGLYTSRADVILDCRGMFGDLEGYGPGGAQAINAESVSQHTHHWLPGDARFESRMLDGQHTILYGDSEQAIRFFEEWTAVFGLATVESATMLTWIVPYGSTLAPSTRLSIASSNATCTMETLGVERIEHNQERPHWKLQLLAQDESTLEITGDVFAAYPKALPTSSIGPSLHVATWLQESATDTGEGATSLFYPDWLGWKQATAEPNYYRLGSREYPHDARGLVEAFEQIRSVFALLGARQDLDLYKILQAQSQ